VELEHNSEQNKDLDLDAIHKGYISTSDTIQFSSDLIVINDNPVMSKYTMKTTDYYYEYINYLMKNNVKDIMSALYLVSPFLHEYFGTNKDYTNQNNRSASFDIMGNQLGDIQKKHGDSMFNEYYKKWFDISIFKNNSMAECTEYAVLTQNLYSFLGANSYYVSGSFSIDKGPNESHAYNLVQLDANSFFIVDTANPTITYDMEYNIVSSRPRIQKISIENFTNAINGNGMSVEFSTCNFQTNGQDTRRIDIINCNYGIKPKTNLKSK
jgi:hypothetical protein